MSKVQNFAGLTQSLPFTEFDFYARYRETFEKTELGRMHRLLPLHEMAENLSLINKSLRPKRGRKSYFTPEGEVALMFLKMYTQLSAPKLMEQLNGNVHYQIFCDIYINPDCPLTNYKLIDDVVAELAGSLKIQQLQDILAKEWKPYMKDLDTMYSERYGRLAARRGKKRALVATAHELFTIVYHVLKDQVVYNELGCGYVDERRKNARIKYHLEVLKNLGVDIPEPSMEIAS